MLSISAKAALPCSTTRGRSSGSVPMPWVPPVIAWPAARLPDASVADDPAALACWATYWAISADAAMSAGKSVT